MERDLLLKDMAEAGYNIGYAAKKHLATYDIVEKAPGWISVGSFAVGVLALVLPAFDNKVLAAALLIVAYALFYFNSYQDGRGRYAQVGSRLTTLFTNLRALYYEATTAGEGELATIQAQVRAIISESQEIGISKQIFLSDWYAHYKFFWQAERSWLNDKRPFTLWRDQIPLSATLTVIAFVVVALSWLGWRIWG